MKLNHDLIDEISKKLRTGMAAKWACQAEGIDESTFYLWKARGKQINKMIADEDGEVDQKKYNKLSEMDKLKFKFFKSVQQSTAEGHAVLVASVYSHIKDDWRAAMELLARRWPRDWGRKDHLHLEAEVEEKPNRLKEIEDEYLADIPESKIKDVAKTFMEAVEAAKEIPLKTDKK
jgi:signal transduction protein with GAF and PtsI domain